MYKKMYLILFNPITSALEDLAGGDIITANWRLADAQRKAEDIFLNWEERPEE